MQKGNLAAVRNASNQQYLGGSPTNTILTFKIILTNQLRSSGPLMHQGGDFIKHQDTGIWQLVYRMSGAAVQHFAETAGRSSLWCPDKVQFRT